MSKRLAHVEWIAAHWHRRQVDKQGAPYIEHLRRVAAAVPERSKAVALLHDALEDVPEQITLATLADALTWQGELDINELEAAAIIARKIPESYDSYIERIANAPGEAGEIAREVKIADLRDNLGRLTPELESLRPRYEQALERLTANRPAEGEPSPTHHQYPPRPETPPAPPRD